MEKNKFIARSLTKEIKKQGNSGHILLPKYFVGEQAEVRIIKKTFICKRCSGVFADKKNFSPDSELCRTCYDANKFLDKNKGKLKCKNCKKEISEEEFKQAWNEEICEDCFILDAEK